MKCSLLGIVDLEWPQHTKYSKTWRWGPYRCGPSFEWTKPSYPRQTTI